VGSSATDDPINILWGNGFQARTLVSCFIAKLHPFARHQKACRAFLKNPEIHASFCVL